MKTSVVKTYNEGGVKVEIVKQDYGVDVNYNIKGSKTLSDGDKEKGIKPTSVKENSYAITLDMAEQKALNMLTSLGKFGEGTGYMWDNKNKKAIRI